ncbi:MAG: SusE domain-containing protein [Bacteroidales bacterium]
MKKNILVYFFIGLISLLAGCKKDGTMVTILTNPIVPTIKTMPSLALLRANATDTLEFVGTPVNPGFTASANYFLEACQSGNNFVNSVTIYSGIQDTVIKMTNSAINGALLKQFTADSTTNIDVRIRAVLIVSSGTGAPGSISNPITYSSAITTVPATIYGLPRLDLINSGMTQKIESALGNGQYAGYVKLDTTKHFTLEDPDNSTIYGASGKAALAVNGSAFIPSNTINIGVGWYYMTADVNAKTYTLTPYMVGLVGAFDNWAAPDSKMEYNPKLGVWSITTALPAGDIKFRLNDDWGWNLGGTPASLTHGGANITLAAAGTYAITLEITVAGPAGSEAGECTIVKQ